SLAHAVLHSSPTRRSSDLLDLDHTVALAGFAAATGHVEAEAARAIAALARSHHLGEQLADRREQAGVGGRIRARRASDRALVDQIRRAHVCTPVTDPYRMP